MDNGDIDRECQEEENLWNEFKIQPNYSTAKFKLFLILACLLGLFSVAQLFIVMVSLTPRLSNLVVIHIGNFHMGILLGLTVFFTTFVAALLIAARADKIRFSHFDNFKKSKLGNR